MRMRCRRTDCVLFFRRAQGCVIVYDLLAERGPPLAEWYPYLAAAGDRELEFRFGTDQLGVAANERVPLAGNNPMVLPGFPVAAPVFPFTAHA